MSKTSRYFERFKPHTTFKHLTLSTYLERWTRKLLLRQGAGDVVGLVDGFAGEGMDDEGQHGSPVRLAIIAAKAQAQLREMRPDRAFRVEVLAVESRRDTFRTLRNNLAPFGDNVRARSGKLEDYLDELLGGEPPTPRMFFLDPFGVKGLEAGVVRRILATRGNEVLALFADEGATRLFGASRVAERGVRADDRSDSQTMLFDQSESIPAPMAELPSEPQRLTGEAATRILDAAFGSHAWAGIIEATPPPRRRSRFIELYRAFLEQTGARYTTVIPVWDEACTPVYTLVHASWSSDGRATMKESVEYALKRCELSPRVKERMRLAMRMAPQHAESALRRQFAGQRVLWARAARPSVQRFALEETDVSVGQLEEMKRRLEDAGILTQRGRAPIECVFPATVPVTP